MILYHWSEDNGAVEPWQQENTKVFEITFDCKQFLVGGAFSTDNFMTIVSFSIGPVSFIYFRQTEKRFR